MIMREPQCEKCKHLWRDEKDYKCNAFPDGIPDKIFEGDHDHKEAFPDDNGFRFEEEK